MKRKIIKCFIIVFVVGLVTACSAKSNTANTEEERQEYSSAADLEVTKSEKVNLYEEYKDYPIYSKEFVYYLLNSDTFDFPDFSKQIEKLEKDLESAETEEMYVYKSEFGDNEGFKHAPKKTEYIYIGEVKNGQPQGVGKVVYTFGSTDWTLGGLLEDAPIKIYEGYFDKGRCDKFGISYLPGLNYSNASYVLGHLVYEGEYDRGNKHGEGKVYYLNSDKLAFKGTFKKNEVSKGTLYLPDGSIVKEGEWKNGICGVVDFYEVYMDNSELTDDDTANVLSDIYDIDVEDARKMQELWEIIDNGEVGKQWEADIIEDRDWEREQFIIPDSGRRYLTESDLRGLNASQLRLARNEIYARHGRAFQTIGYHGYVWKCNRICCH